MMNSVAEGLVHCRGLVVDIETKSQYTCKQL